MCARIRLKFDHGSPDNLEDAPAVRGRWKTDHPHPLPVRGVQAKWSRAVARTFVRYVHPIRIHRLGRQTVEGTAAFVIGDACLALTASGLLHETETYRLFGHRTSSRVDDLHRDRAGRQLRVGDGRDQIGHVPRDPVDDRLVLLSGCQSGNAKQQGDQKRGPHQSSFSNRCKMSSSASARNASVPASSSCST